MSRTEVGVMLAPFAVIFESRNTRFRKYLPARLVEQRSRSTKRRYHSKPRRWGACTASPPLRPGRNSRRASSSAFVEKGRRIQFYHSVTNDDKALVWFRPYEPPPEVPDNEYPLWLCTGRVLEHWHTGTMTMRVPQLHRAMPQAYVEVHPEDAARLGIGNGSSVIVESRRGQITLRAWIQGRGAPPKGVIFVPFFDERLLVNLVTLDAHDPFSKQPDYKKCAVRLRKAPV